MTDYSAHKPPTTKDAAAFRFRQLVDELKMLTGAFPDLHDAFDPDELPLEFILRRDSQPDPGARRLRPIPAPARASSPEMPAHAGEHRGGEDPHAARAALRRMGGARARRAEIAHEG